MHFEVCVENKEDCLSTPPDESDMDRNYAASMDLDQIISEPVGGKLLSEDVLCSGRVIDLLTVGASAVDAGEQFGPIEYRMEAPGVGQPVEGVHV